MPQMSWPTSIVIDHPLEGDKHIGFRTADCCRGTWLDVRVPQAGGGEYTIHFPHTYGVSCTSFSDSAKKSIYIDIFKQVYKKVYTVYTHVSVFWKRRIGSSLFIRYGAESFLFLAMTEDL